MKISVCMATYNGAAFLEEQLASILPQLGVDDELIVSDDGSTDASCEIVEALSDTRVFLLRNDIRLGYVRNFERALAAAKGDLLFLSDQDDVWAPNKLARMINVFETHAGVAMAHHEMVLMDEAGRSIRHGESLGEGVRSGPAFIAREFVKARLWGCALGIRASAVRTMLPFPSCVYAHDHWATIVGGLAGGIYLLPESLVFHRLHASNVTPRRGLPWLRRFVVRVDFLRMVICAISRVRQNVSGQISGYPG